MCVRTLRSDPAHPLICHNCLPNEEQIESPQKFKYLKKNWCMNKKIASKANIPQEQKMPH